MLIATRGVIEIAEKTVPGESTIETRIESKVTKENAINGPLLHQALGEKQKDMGIRQVLHVATRSQVMTVPLSGGGCRMMR
jgi:hypothetical protein